MPSAELPMVRGKRSARILRSVAYRAQARASRPRVHANLLRSCDNGPSRQKSEPRRRSDECSKGPFHESVLERMIGDYGHSASGTEEAGSRAEQFLERPEFVVHRYAQGLEHLREDCRRTPPDGSFDATTHIRSRPEQCSLTSERAGNHSRLTKLTELPEDVRNLFLARPPEELCSGLPL